MGRILKSISCIAIACLVTGCKLAVMVDSGGNVQSDSGLRDCTGPGYCEFDITDPEFSDTFTAIPRPGFEFVKWQDGSDFFCADSTDPVCTVEMPEGALAETIVSLFRTGSIRPLFRGEGVDTDDDGVINELDEDDDNDGLLDVADNCPLDGPDFDGFGCPTIPEFETYRLNEKIWLQPMLITGITWHDVADICPPPDYVCSGKLDAFDVSGWIWASGEEVTEILNAFLGTSLGAVPDWVYDPDPAPLDPSIFDVFYPYSNCCTNDQLWGWVRNEANISQAHPYGFSCNDLSDDTCQSYRAGAYLDGDGVAKTWGEPNRGVWLYKPR